jgi:hypothetical protein
MPKMLIKATELTDTNVDYVSMVKHAANRLPFRITKKEDEVMDLYALGRRLFQKAEPVASVVAIVTQKTDVKPTKLQAIAKSCGLPGTLKKSEDGGLVTISAEGVDTSKVFLVKLDKNIAVAVAHSSLKKAFPDQDYVLGPNALRKSYQVAVKEAFEKAETIAEAHELVQKAGDDFKAQLALLEEHLPEAVFKADKALKAVGTGNAAGGAADDQETGDDEGDEANGGGPEVDEDDGADADDPEMPPKNAKTGTRAAKGGDGGAGKNGTGEGAEMGQGTGTNPRATDDDEDEEIDAAPGGAVSGDNSGMPAKAKAPTKKQSPEMMDDDSVNGAQSDLPAKAKAKTKKAVGGADGGEHKECPSDIEVRNVGDRGEGARQAPEADATDMRPEDQAESEAGAAGGKVAGKTKGKTLDMDGVPAKAKAPTQKNEGDAAVGQKAKSKPQEMDDEMSGSGAQAKDVRSYQKADAGVMQALQSLAKSVQESNERLTKTVTELAKRVDSVSDMVKKADAAINGTVFNVEAEDRQTWTRKSEANLPPLMDTGYSRRRA